MPDALQRALSIDDLRRLASSRLPRFVFDFIDGGAEDEITLRRNRQDFERIELLPRVLVDVSEPRLQTVLLGSAAAAPFVIAPMGSCMLAWPGADLAIARAAAALGLPYTLSTMSTTALEQVASKVDGRLWFQLYVLRDRAFTLALVDRARAADYETLVVTVDLPTGGKRERDLRNGISIPLRPNVRQLLDIASRPAWALRMLRQGSPQFENVRGLLSDGGNAGLTIAAKVGQNLDASFNWDALARIRERWPRRLLVKGVQHPQDAARLVELGVDGIWVSNHGGRQLDGAQSAVASLPAVVQAVAGRAEVLLDSGVRRGSDALKAMALGAKAVAIGRAALFGAAAGGETGARRALEILLDELRRSMQLSGVASVAECSPGLLAPERGPGAGRPVEGVGARPY